MTGFTGSVSIALPTAGAYARLGYEVARPAGVTRCIVVGTKVDAVSAAEASRYWDVASQRLVLGEGMETFLTR